MKVYGEQAHRPWNWPISRDGQVQFNRLCRTTKCQLRLLQCCLQFDCTVEFNCYKISNYASDIEHVALHRFDYIVLLVFVWLIGWLFGWLVGWLIWFGFFVCL